MTASQQPRDNWDPTIYSEGLSHIPTLATTLLAWTTPQPTDAILDIGCGNGALTAQVARKVPDGRVLGLDSSPAMAQDARDKYCGNDSNMEFVVQDCTKLDIPPSIDSVSSDHWQSSWDWIFSNSALHWVLGDPATRMKVLHDMHSLLKPGGHLVFEFGGAGHVADAITALNAALVVFAPEKFSTAERRKEVSPWLFPSEEWMRSSLEQCGFEVVKYKTQYRPTQLSTSAADGRISELESWVRTLGFPYLDAIATKEEDPIKRDKVVRWVCEVLEGSIERKEDSTAWLGYVRLRFLARKRL